MSAVFVKGLAAVAVGFFIILFFALHPSINAYHTGLAGLIVSVTFLAATLAGGLGKRSYVLIAILMLAFVEPEITITNTLQFNIVSNGLIIGAGTSWILEKPRIPKTSIPILGVVGGMIAMTLVFPAIVGALTWIHIHDALMFVKYGVIAVLAFSCSNRDVKSIVIVLAVASSIVAAVAITNAFHFSWFGHWMYETYFASRNYPADEVTYYAEIYPRSFGVADPVGTALLLVMSLGAWFVLIIRSRSKMELTLASIGMNAALIGIFLTGSRIGIVTAAPVLVFGLIWWSALGRPKIQARILVVTAVLAIGAMFVVSTLNESFGASTDAATTRLVSTIPNLLQNTPDDSIRQRLDEVSETRLSFFRISGERDSSRNNEYLMLLERYGLAGFLLVWQLWLMIVVRATRAATIASNIGDRSIGMMAMVVVTTVFISGISTAALLEPSRMVVLLVLTGFVPVLSPHRYSVPAVVPVALWGDEHQSTQLAA